MTYLLPTLERHGFDATSLKRLEMAHLSIYSMLVPGSAAITQWHTLRALVHETGHWPVLLGGDLDLTDLSDVEAHQHPPPPAIALKAALALDSAHWLHDRRVNHPYRDDITDTQLYEDWPTAVQPFDDSAFLLPYSFSTGQLAPTYLGFVPTMVNWQIPVLMQFGGWNRCPLPFEHASVLRRWEAHYGAEVVGMGRRRVELRILHPPHDSGEALQLAEEHFAYCPEIVAQGAGTITQLAAALLHASAWAFWWD